MGQDAAYKWKETDLAERILNIQGPDEAVMELARSRQESLAKPPGSLGVLENISVQLAGITGKVQSDVKRQCVTIFCADNGVVSEGVASAPQSVTMAQTVNFTRRLTGVGALAKYFGVDLLVVDMGIDGTVPASLRTESVWKRTSAEGARELAVDKIVDRKIAHGTRNLAVEPAMDRAQAVEAVGAGLEMAAAVKEAGYDVFGVGEMGIGNTTTTAAVISALLSLPADRTVGKGGGITDESFTRKRAIVDGALAREGLPAEQADVLDVLAKVGGFDIAAMAGAFLGAALYRLPVVIDGYISAAAALSAVRLEAQIRREAGLSGGHQRSYLFASHLSWEQGYGPAVEALGLRPVLNLDMRLGEGSGCPLAFKIMEGACAAMNGMATFAEAEIDDDYLEEIRKGDCF